MCTLYALHHFNDIFFKSKQWWLWSEYSHSYFFPCTYTHYKFTRIAELQNAHCLHKAMENVTWRRWQRSLKLILDFIAVFCFFLLFFSLLFFVKYIYWLSVRSHSIKNSSFSSLSELCLLFFKSSIAFRKRIHLLVLFSTFSFVLFSRIFRLFKYGSTSIWLATKMLNLPRF